MRLEWLRFFRRSRTLGQQGETLAARFLKKKGYKIVARSHRSALGEIDLVAVDPRAIRGPTLVFIEVKTRTGQAMGYPEEAVDKRKKRILSQLAVQYRTVHQLTEYPARFDVVSILWPVARAQPEVVHFQDAFDCELDTP
jgi:putative endonuclease